ncbi:hypothetical protein COP2_036720 [Malus domestica]
MVLRFEVRVAIVGKKSRQRTDHIWPWACLFSFSTTFLLLNAIRVLAADLPEDSVRLLIGAAQPLEHFFKQKPHGYRLSGVPKIQKIQSTNRTEQSRQN